MWIGCYKSEWTYHWMTLWMNIIQQIQNRISIGNVFDRNFLCKLKSALPRYFLGRHEMPLEWPTSLKISRSWKGMHVRFSSAVLILIEIFLKNLWTCGSDLQNESRNKRNIFIVTGRTDLRNMLYVMFTSHFTGLFITLQPSFRE